MGKLLKVLKGATEVLTTAGAVLAAAIVVVETYQVLRKSSTPQTESRKTRLLSDQQSHL